jgi:hypothetical protein
LREATLRSWWNISNELADQRGSSRAAEMQPTMLYQNRQVILTNSCHFRARISSNSTVGACPESSAKLRAPIFAFPKSIDEIDLRERCDTRLQLRFPN